MLIVRRKVSCICYRKIGKIIKEHQLGAITLLIAKVYDDFMIIEARTGLFLTKAKNLALILESLKKQDSKRIRERLDELPSLLNIYQRRVYEFA